MIQIYTRTQTKRVYLYVNDQAYIKKKKKKKERGKKRERKSFIAICLLFRSSRIYESKYEHTLFIYTDIYDYSIAMR